MTAESIARRSAAWRNWLTHHLRLNEDLKFEIYANVASSASLRDATYWAELLLSAGIATLGLTLNSPAVIIGAMLISPLMSPIMSSGLALAAGDFLLALRAVINIGLSSLAAVLFSTVLVTLLPFREMTTEIAARTHPNTLDLVVALFSGAVGALAVCKSMRGVATSIPGVAIAVALMPPLCVTGYGIGVFLTTDRAQGMAILGGGALLFVTNLVAITFASMLVFLLVHIDSTAVREKIRESRRSDREAQRFQRAVKRLIPVEVERIGSLPARLILVAALLVVVFVPLKRSFDALSTEIRHRQQLNRTHRAATEAWQRFFGTTRTGSARSYIDWLDTEERNGSLNVTVRVFISESISPEERDAYSRALGALLNRNADTIHVSIVEIPTSTYQIAKAKKEAEAAPPPVQESAGVRFRKAGQEILARIGAARLPPNATMLDASLTIGPGSPVVTMAYLAPDPISEDARSLIAGDLRDQLELPALDVTLVHVPSRTVIAFDRHLPKLNDAAIASLGALGATAGPRLALNLVIQSTGLEGLDGRRVSAVRNALIGYGVAETRLTAAVNDAVPRDQVMVIVERAVAAPS